MSMTVADFEAEAARAAELAEAAWQRFAADLDRYPESPTLNALAIRDDTGELVGQTAPSDGLGLAYENGADASLIVEAERPAALVGSIDDPGGRHRAVRLAHAVRAMNRRLARYGTSHALGTVTVVADVHRVLLAAELAARADSSSVPSEPHAHDPPPIDAATTSPHRPCAPPTPCVRGHEWLPHAGTVGDFKEGVGVRPLTA